MFYSTKLKELGGAGTVNYALIPTVTRIKG